MNNKYYLLNTLHITIDSLFDSIPVLLSFIVLTYSANEREVGIILSSSNMLNTLAGLSALFFSRRFGLFRTLIFTTALFGLGFVANAFSTGIFFTGLCIIIGGMGFSIFHNTAFSYLSTTTDRQSLGKTIGNFTAYGDIGRIPLTALAGFIAAFSICDFAGWRIVCLTYGVAALLFAAFAFIFSKSLESEHNPEVLKKNHFPAFSLLCNRQYALPIVASVLDAISSTQVFAFLPYLLFSKGIDPKIIGTFALAFTLGCFIGKVLLGRAVDLMGCRKVFVASELVMALFLLLLIFSQELVAVITSALLLGVVTRGTVPVVQMIITSPVKEKHLYEDVISINGFCRGVSTIASPLIYGFVAASYDVSWSFAIMAVTAVLAIMPVLVMDNVEAA